jgi:Secretion system C-terminal sorting domain
MTKAYLLSACLVASLTTQAQHPFNTMDSVDINNINALVLVHGDMWWNPVQQVAHTYFRPASGPRSVNFEGSLWMSGYDDAGKLHVAAQTYRQEGNDYWPGPLDGTDTLTYTNSQAWAKIWKVNRTDIQYFQGLSTHTVANTPVAILTWPATGNSYATGNGGVSLTVTGNMAPFVDVNSNGIYEPLAGDYPDVPGDQALWWIFSDNGPTHSQTNGVPFKLEVHAMAYAYKRNTLIDNVIYYDYTVVNRSANNYHNFRLCQFDDADLGWYGDDFIGFDSTWRMGIDYNGTNDDGAGAGHPLNSYGVDPPQMGITMLLLPGDSAGNYVPVGNFVYYNNDASTIGNPTTDTQYSNYMRGRVNDTMYLSNDFQGPGISSIGWGHGTAAQYVYPGDPSDTTQWSECASVNNPGDRRFILASNDFSLNAGSTQHLIFAMVVADSAGGCPDASFSKISIVADTAWNIFHNPLPPLPNGVPNVAIAGGIKIYPNPASTQLFIDGAVQYGTTSIEIYNAIGQRMSLPLQKSGSAYTADVSSLAPGLYAILLRSGDVLVEGKFIKE